jgi:hypothetical protein
MKTQFIRLLSLIALTGMLGACKKSSPGVNIRTGTVTAGAVVSDASPLSGSVKGTMATGKTYTVSSDITVNKGDTLLLQPGVTVNMGAGTNIIVKGTLLSLGTKTQPNFITAANMTRNDVPGASVASDPAYAGTWGGIQADTSCKKFILKWTHLQYAGATLKTVTVYGATAGSAALGIFFQTPNGTFVVEDSWIYGTAADGIRLQAGNISIMRNTFEKIGKIGGEGVSIKGPTVGNIAYNVFAGTAQNGVKFSNNSAGAVQCRIYVYNNTFINSGWKTIQLGRGASINAEEGASGKVYNNFIINCKYGLRLVKTPPADTANLAYGNQYYYGDADSVVNQFYPVGYITRPRATDYPAPTYLPAVYTLGASYSALALIHANNPLFANFTLPATTAQFKDISYVNGFDLRLQAASPAIGKGFTGFSPLTNVSVHANYGATEITVPGNDIGAYLANGKGNQH